MGHFARLASVACLALLPTVAQAISPEVRAMTILAASPDWTGRWTRLEVADKAGTLRPLPDPSRLTFEVDADLRVSASVGCNRIGTQIVPGQGNEVTFAPGMATRMACEGEIGVAEERFLAAMTKVAGYERRGNDVVFLGADGEALLLIGR